MRNTFITVLSVLLFINQGYSQWGDAEKGLHKVFSTGGLNVREAPSVQSKVIRKLPFGTVVTRVDTVRYGQELVDTVQFDLYESNIVETVRGKWAKVYFGDEEGFVWEAYIERYFGQDDYSPDTLDFINSDVHLFNHWIDLYEWEFLFRSGLSLLRGAVE